MNAKNQKKEHICVITRNKRFFEHIVNTFKKADYEYVDVANTEKCCDKKSGYNCDLKIVATVTPDSREHSGNIPIVVIGGSEDINSVVKSIKIGVFDFVESAMGSSGMEKLPVSIKKFPVRKIKSFDEYTKLTQTERIILHQIMKGKSNRQIADKLHRSIRTIEDHRNHIMQKINANNLVDLVKKCLNEQLIVKKQRKIPG